MPASVAVQEPLGHDSISTYKSSSYLFVLTSVSRKFTSIFSSSTCLMIMSLVYSNSTFVKRLSSYIL